MSTLLGTRTFKVSGKHIEPSKLLLYTATLLLICSVNFVYTVVWCELIVKPHKTLNSFAAATIFLFESLISVVNLANELFRNGYRRKIIKHILKTRDIFLLLNTKTDYTKIEREGRIYFCFVFIIHMFLIILDCICYNELKITTQFSTVQIISFYFYLLYNTYYLTLFLLLVRVTEQSFKVINKNLNLLKYNKPIGVRKAKKISLKKQVKILQTLFKMCVEICKGADYMYSIQNLIQTLTLVVTLTTMFYDINVHCKEVDNGAYFKWQIIVHHSYVIVFRSVILFSVSSSCGRSVSQV